MEQEGREHQILIEEFKNNDSSEEGKAQSSVKIELLDMVILEHSPAQSARSLHSKNLSISNLSSVRRLGVGNYEEKWVSPRD